MRAAGEDDLGDVRAHNRAEEDARNRQHPRDEPLPQPDDPGDRDDDEQDPVQPGHSPRLDGRPWDSSRA